jgi:YtkA-like
MTVPRWLVAGFSLGFLLSLTPGCAPTWSCGPDSCTGCCDAQDRCVGEGDASACGKGGELCRTCDQGIVCVQGLCTIPQNGSGGGTASTGGGAGGSGGFGGSGGSGGTGGAGGTGGTGGGSALAPTNPLVFEATITPSPPRLGTNTMTVVVKGSNGVVVPDAAVTARTWMPAMGHGSANPSVSNQGGGNYRVSGVSFTMSGTWEVRLSATAVNGSLSGSTTLTYTVN